MVNLLTFKNFLILIFLSIIPYESVLGQDSPIKALLITGGGWHDYERQEKLLTEGINERLNDQIEWTIIHEGNKKPDHQVSIMKENNWTDGYDVIVHNTGFGRVEDSNFVSHFVEHHKGTPAVIIHATVHSYRYAEPADSWFKFIGLQSMSHESQRTFNVENIATTHPIMKTFPQVWLSPVDEVYKVEKLWGDITPLARAYGVETGKYHTVIWTHVIDDTRIFATSLGHTNEVFEQNVFLNQVTNGLLWAVERL